MDNGLVASEFTVDEAVEKLDGVYGDLDVGGGTGWADCTAAAGQLLVGKLAAVKGVLDKGERIGDVAYDGM